MRIGLDARYVYDHFPGIGRYVVNLARGLAQLDHPHTLVLLHTCPHPLNPTTDYPRKPIRYQFRKAAPVAADDLCRTSRPENARGFANTELYTACAPVVGA